jgi:hypothetical protein
MYKRKWAIELNAARQLYLDSYKTIDDIDQGIEACNIQYQSWKYWHAAKNHALALAWVIAYDMYVECSTEQRAKESFGFSSEDDFLVKDFRTFRQDASTQGLQYDPFFCLYPGDRRFRVNVGAPKARRSVFAGTEDSDMGRTGKRKRGRPKKAQELPREVTPEVFSRSKKDKYKSRLCGDLRQYTKHEESIDHVSSKLCKNGKKCAWCGEPCWSFCGLCKDPVTDEHPFLHHCPTRGHAKGRVCFTNYHNDMMFGLGRTDSKHFAKPKAPKPKEWTPPTRRTQQQHAKMIQEIVQELEEE